MKQAEAALASTPLPEPMTEGNVDYASIKGVMRRRHKGVLTRLITFKLLWKDYQKGVTSCLNSHGKTSKKASLGVTPLLVYTKVPKYVHHVLPFQLPSLTGTSLLVFVNLHSFC